MYLISILEFLFIIFLSHNIKLVNSLRNVQNIDLNKFKIVTLNDDGSHSINDKTKYKYEPDYGDTYYEIDYKFKNWTKCVKVMYGDDVVWSHDSLNEKEYPMQITLFDGPFNELELFFNLSKYYYEFIDGKWDLYRIAKRRRKLSTQSFKSVDPLMVENKFRYSQLEYCLAFGVLFLLMSALMSTGLTVNYFKSKARLNKFKSTSVTVV